MPYWWWKSSPKKEPRNTDYRQIHGGNPLSSFQAGTGLQWQFCQRHGIRQLSLQGEKLSSDLDASDPFKEKLLKMIEDVNDCMCIGDTYVHACMYLYPLWCHNCMYKLIFHISKMVLAPTILDIRGSTVVLPYNYSISGDRSIKNFAPGKLTTWSTQESNIGTHAEEDDRKVTEESK